MPELLARRLEADEAAAWHAAAGLPLVPATLHPSYLVADAARDAALEPWFIGVEDGRGRWLHGVHVTRIPDAGGARDASSPYGYGGPVSTSTDPSFLADAWAADAAFMREHGVVVEYLRFHPLLGNDAGYPGHASDNRTVVSIGLQGDFASAYPVRIRQGLRKAQAAVLAYFEADLAAHAPAFGAYHRAALQAMGVDAFYLFPDTYFERLAQGGRARLGACVDAAGRWLAAAVFLDGPGVREYHLAAAAPEGRRVSAAAFLLHEAALSARAAGRAEMYLGGGTSAAPDDALLFFKGSFSPRRLTYRTGCTVFDAAAYDRLKSLYPAGYAAHPQRPIFHRLA